MLSRSPFATKVGGTTNRRNRETAHVHNHQKPKSKIATQSVDISETQEDIKKRPGKVRGKMRFAATARKETQQPNCPLHTQMCKFSGHAGVIYEIKMELARTTSKF